MKWSVTILVTLGLLAGLSASILVKFMRSDGAEDSGATETEVVLVLEDLSPMTVLKSSHLTVKSVAKNKLPVGCITDPVQAIGKILAVPVVKEQMLTEFCFVKDGSRKQVAAMLPEGMRAVSLSLSSSSISGGLLYPGCVVDVLASFRLTSSSERGQALSTTLLRSIQVLAVEGDSVVSQKDEEDEKKQTTARSSQSKLTVTLMVDPRQAEALQLASGQGNISLALRNPLDTSPVDTEATVLSQGRLAQLGSAMAAAVIADESKGGNGEGTEHDTPGTETIFGPAEPGGGNGGTASAKPVSQKNYREDVNKGRLSWPVTVIRGTKVQQQDLDLPEVKISANVSGSR